MTHRILLGITGSIAAYKTPELLRLLQDAGMNVKIILTEQGSRFVAPLTLRALCQDAVFIENDYQRQADWEMQHIQLARWAESILIAPASANCLAKLAQGFADDLLTTTYIASQSRLLIAPAMNPIMWQHPATQENVCRLKARGAEFLGPAIGDHACGEQGLGRLLEPAALVEQLATLLTPTNHCLQGRRILITAGPTQEPLDPIRFISNHSSGQMGYALAQAAIEGGAKVTLVSGPTALTPPPSATVMQVTTAQEMHNAITQVIQQQDIVIAAAAVGDYYSPHYSAQKIKKQPGTTHITLELHQNPDIIASIKAQYPHIFCVGFAAETDHLIAYATQKLQTKQLDLIIANLVHADYGMGKANNAVTIIDKTLKLTELPCQSKLNIARSLVQYIGQHFYNNSRV